MSKEQNMEETKNETPKKKRTRRALTPATAVTKCIDALSKLEAGEREQALRSVLAFFGVPASAPTDGQRGGDAWQG
jgi:hypothetical protein